MKHFISLVLAGVMTAVSVTFSSPTVTAETEHHDNVLITYFSRAGENYNVGVVERGNTDLLAEIVAEETGGELFRIETVKEYPSAYDEMLTVATEERTNKERPELKTSIENFDTYDVIFVGYPIWWGDMPMAMYTFLESYDWNGKTVIPFNTHEGSGQANTVATILALFNAQGEVLDIGRVALRIVSFVFPFSGLTLILGAFFQALGNSRKTLLTSVVQLVIMLTSAIILSKVGTVNTVWFAFVITEVLVTLLAVILMKEVNSKTISKIPPNVVKTDLAAEM